MCWRIQGPRVYNALPFAVELEAYRWQHWQANIDWIGLLDTVLNSRLNVPTAGFACMPLTEINLTDQQTRWIKQLASEYTSVQFMLEWSCRSAINDGSGAYEFPVFVCAYAAEQARMLTSMTRTPENPPRRHDLQQDMQLFQTPDGRIHLDVRLQQDTVWLTQAQMMALFDRDQSVISRHINNVFKGRELPSESNMQKMHSAGSDKPVAVYSSGADPE